MDEESQIETLASTVAVLSDHLQEEAGQALVVKMALLALVRSHPDQAAFAREFLRCWQLSGSHHSNDALDPRTAAGIDKLLSQLEEVCPALDVRPPRT